MRYIEGRQRHTDAMYENSHTRACPHISLVYMTLCPPLELLHRAFLRPLAPTIGPPLGCTVRVQSRSDGRRWASRLDLHRYGSPPPAEHFLLLREKRGADSDAVDDTVAVHYAVLGLVVLEGCAESGDGEVALVLAALGEQLLERALVDTRIAVAKHVGDALADRLF